MLGVRADDPHDAFAADDLAVFADPPDAASNFHDLSTSSLSKTGSATGESVFIAAKRCRLKSWKRPQAMQFA
jgi:hypothetical protein